MVFVTLRRLLLAVCFFLLTLSLVVAQVVLPSNTTANTSVEFLLETILNQNNTVFPLWPLTHDAGISSIGTVSDLNERSGPLALTTPNTVKLFQPGDIAYISCEPSDYSSGDISAGNTINSAVSNKPNAIVLYSVYAATCILSASGDFQYSFIYTMQNSSSSTALVDGLQKNNPPYPYSNIYENETSSAGAPDSQSASTDTPQTENLITGIVFGVVTPVTVVAMGLYYFCITRRTQRRKQQFTASKVDSKKARIEGDNVQLYFQQKAELDDEQRRHEMEAVEVRYEMEGESEIQEIVVEGRGRERHFDRQEMRGEEHSKELD